MRIAKFNRPIALERRIEEPDGQGGITRTWAPWLRMWAWIEPLSGGENLLAAQLEGHLIVRFHVRYPGSASNPETWNRIRHTMRVVYEGRQFNIQSIVQPDENHRELTLLCEELIGLAVKA